jgi:hypothetical protein
VRVEDSRPLAAHRPHRVPQPVHAVQALRACGVCGVCVWVRVRGHVPARTCNFKDDGLGGLRTRLPTHAYTHIRTVRVWVRVDAVAAAMGELIHH